MRTYSVLVTAEREGPLPKAGWLAVEADSPRGAAVDAVRQAWPAGAGRCFAWVALGRDRHPSGMPCAAHCFELCLAAP